MAVLNSDVLRMLVRGERMGYRIHYRSGEKKDRKLRSYSRLMVLIAVCFLIFLFLVEGFWPEGAERMKKMSLLSEEIIPVSAFHDLENGLRQGESLIKLWTAFCRNIVS